MRKARVAALGILAFLGGCVGDLHGPQIGRPAVDYTATTLEGDSISLASLRGEVVLLNLWATWCGPCRTETPYLQSLFEDYKAQGFSIVGVSLDTGDASEDIEIFVEEYGGTYTILHDPMMKGMDLYQVLGLPATFLVDREGILRWMRSGPILEGDEEFLQALEELLS